MRRFEFRLQHNIVQLETRPPCHKDRNPNIEAVRVAGHDTLSDDTLNLWRSCEYPDSHTSTEFCDIGKLFQDSRIARATGSSPTSRGRIGGADIIDVVHLMFRTSLNTALLCLLCSMSIGDLKHLPLSNNYNLFRTVSEGHRIFQAAALLWSYHHSKS